MAYITFQPSDFFNTHLYSGNGSTNAQTGVGFQPDWVWVKDRGTSSSHEHYAFDSVRGTTKYVKPNATSAEGTASGITSFDSDGFTLGSSDGMNENSRNFVSWNWKGNGAGSANTNGTINSTATSANTTSGVSIIKYTGDGNSGATIGHGLGVAPKLVIIKKLNGADAWFATGTDLGWNKYIILSASGAESGSSNSSFTGTAATTTVFSVGSDSGVNGNGDTYVAYVFAETKGFSRISKWTGNGSTNGPFMYCGFKPAFVISKNLNRNENWVIHDNKRSTYNVNATKLSSNDDSGESTNAAFNMDFLSNGFKIKSTDTALNQGGEVYLYMAFSAEPLVASNGDVATAR